MASEYDFTAWRHAQWGGSAGNASVRYYGVDWHSATFAMAICANPGDVSAAITLTNQAAGAQGISASYDPNAVHPTSGQVVGATTILPQIDKATLEAQTPAVPATADLELYYTLYVTPSGQAKRAILFGKFIVKPGAPN